MTARCGNTHPANVAEEAGDVQAGDADEDDPERVSRSAERGPPAGGTDAWGVGQADVKRFLGRTTSPPQPGGSCTTPTHDGVR